MMLWLEKIPFVEIPPTCRAKFATGKGNASKSEVVSAVSSKTGIAFVGKGSEDMCDAFILEEMVLTRAGTPRFDWPEVNKSALTKIEWTELEKVIEPPE